MDQVKLFTKKVRRHLLTILIANNFIIFGGWWLGQRWFGLTFMSLFISLAIVGLIVTILFALISTEILSAPTKMIAQAILHVSPGESPIGAPDDSQIYFGKELVDHMTSDIYKISKVAEDVSPSPLSTPQNPSKTEQNNTITPS